MTDLPKGFSYLQDPRIISQIAYYSAENFVGRRIASYNKPVCIATDRVLAGISRVQDDLDALDLNLALKVFDAYRPQTAVNDFEQWSLDSNDTIKKQDYYPSLSKQDLFAQGYLLKRSTHSRGGAIDLTIVAVDPLDKMQHAELDMGTIFDFFGDESHTDYPDLPPIVRANRQMLKLVMEKHGFKNYHKEWWHFNIINEEYPNTYFDFPIE